MASRHYLHVPYSEKEEAKRAARAAGFRLEWAGGNRWLVPSGIDVTATALARWLPEHTPSPQAAFAAAIRAIGLHLEGEPTMDGHIHRVPVDGDKGKERSGAYAGHLVGQVPGGYIQNFRTFERVNWKYEGHVDRLTPETREQLQREAQERTTQRGAENAHRHEAAAQVAALMFKESFSATPEHSYCAAKRIAHPAAHGLRIVPAQVSTAAMAAGIRIAATVQQAGEMRTAEPDAYVFLAGDLLIPARDSDGKMWSLQSVNLHFKGNMKHGRKVGLYAVTGNSTEEFDTKIQQPLTPIVIAEGYATGDTVARLEPRYAVVAAFSSTNLAVVARQLRDQWPDRLILIAADNDHRSANAILPNGTAGKNAGVLAAAAAAKACHAGVLIPPFAATDHGSDWNDYARLYGEAFAADEFKRQVVQATMEAAMTKERLVTVAHDREANVHDDPTTSADDLLVAREREAAHELTGRAIAGEDEVRRDAAQALAMSGRSASTLLAEMHTHNVEQAEVLTEQRMTAEDSGRAISQVQHAADTRAGEKPVWRRGRGQDFEL